MSQAEGEAIVQFDNVGLRYGTDKEVLRNLSFTLFPGSFYFLTGASGAGKTSLLRLLYLAQRPSRGMIRMFGADAITLPRDRLPALRRRIGVVFQDFRLVSHLSAFDNVALPLRVAGASDRDLRRPVSDMLEWVGLADRMDARPATLSGGEQQRVAIARAVIARPDILVAEWDGELAGWGSCEKADDFITDLWVLPEYQGRGIGTALLDKIESGIRQRGYSAARLDTHARNIGAIRLYKRLGYRVKTYFVTYSEPLDEDIDKVEMIKEFEPGSNPVDPGTGEYGLYDT